MYAGTAKRPSQIFLEPLTESINTSESVSIELQTFAKTRNRNISSSFIQTDTSPHSMILADDEMNETFAGSDFKTKPVL